MTCMYKRILKFRLCGIFRTRPPYPFASRWFRVIGIRITGICHLEQKLDMIQFPIFVEYNPVNRVMQKRLQLVCAES
jgi:hypothetical protein